MYRKLDGTQVPECNEAMARNATNHGVPWGVIEGFGKFSEPSSMMWLGAEDAECWGFMRWSRSDTSNDGIGCWKWAMKLKPADVTANNASEVLCRMNAGSSRTFVSTGRDGQGFSDAYQRACERIAADPRTPKYAAIDIIMWLSLTDPNVSALKPFTLMVHILDADLSQINSCWKCLTIGAMSDLMHGDLKAAVEHFQGAVNRVKLATGSVPAWLTNRLDFAVAEAAKQNR